MKTPLRAIAIVLALTLPLAGCLELDQGIALQPDLSGTATFSMVVDMNGMIPFIAKMQKDMQGQPGEPTEEELAAVRKEVLEKQEQDREQEDAELADKRAQLEKSLPAGIKLQTFEVKRDELRMTLRMGFEFDHISKLATLELPAEEENPGDEAPPGAPSEAQMKRPFEGLVVEETPEQVTITFRPNSPLTSEEPAAAEPGEEGGMEEAMPGMEKMVEDMTKGLRVGFTITTPLEVVESNQTKKDGETLTWTFDKDTITRLQKQEAGGPPTPRVVLRKQK